MRSDERSEVGSARSTEDRGRNVSSFREGVVDYVARDGSGDEAVPLQALRIVQGIGEVLGADVDNFPKGFPMVPPRPLSFPFPERFPKRLN